MKRLFLFSITLACIGYNFAQGPIEYVKEYNQLVESYLKDDDVEMREKIDDLLRGGFNKCYISNRIGQDIAHERNIDVELLHSDTYHNQLMNWYRKGVVRNYKLSDIVWQRDWEEPRIKMSKDESPVMFVSANVHTDGSRVYNTSDLFYIQNGHIVNIVDLSSEGLGNAIRLYNMERYDEAFSIFRKIAHTKRNALKARYYTAVMLITGKGCKHIAPKVRDHEAAWLGLSGYLSGDEDLSSLARKFSMQLPFSENNIVFRPAAYDGRRVIKKGKKYGIIDDSGRMILDFREGTCSPLSGDGYACVSTPGIDKLGLMDASGRMVLPYEYDQMFPYFYDDKIYVIRNNNLQLLSRTGVLLKNIEGEFSHMTFATNDGHVLVYNKGFQLYDYTGALVLDTKDFDKFVISKSTGLLELKKDKQKVWEGYIRW